MEDLYSIHPGISRAGEVASVRSATSFDDGSLLRFEVSPAATAHRSGASDASEICDAAAAGGPDLTDFIKARIATHPRYPSLLSAYIDCRKVGAPPEMATLLEEIGRKKYTTAGCGEMGADPELDEFMESYCRLLLHYKEELSKPFDEAASFLTGIEAQLRNLSATSSVAGDSPSADEAAGSSDEEPSSGDVDAPEARECDSRVSDHELKDMLLKKYSGYLSNLKKEFLKKRKKGKLPKDARSALLDWWNSHYRWPYPTEEEKAKLAEATGLDHKQINNWFINQRKRHWKPSEDMQFALMQGVSGGSSGTTMLYFDTGTIGP